MIGRLYHNGWGIEKNYEAALLWSSKAAEGGDIYAQERLGFMYYNAQGVPRNYSESAKWFRMAAAGGDALSQFYLGIIANHNCHLACLNCLVDRSQCGEMLEWYKKAADQGYQPAQRALANNLRYGKNNYGEAAKWFRMAAKQQDAYSEFQLGLLYEEGKGVPRDGIEARNWFQLALDHSRNRAERGEGESQFIIGLIYKNGFSVPRNYVTAYMWLTLAASKGIGSARTNIHDLEGRMPAEQIAEAQKLAKNWLPGDARMADAAEAPKEGPPDVAAGLIISNGGVVLTIADVVTGCPAITVRFGDAVLAARIVSTDSQNNLALLNIGIPTTGLLPLRSASRLGDRFFVYNPRAATPDTLEGAVIVGNIQELFGAGNDSRFMRLSIPFLPSLVGAPIFDHLGNIVGIVAGKSLIPAKGDANVTYDLGDAFAIKSSVIGSFLDASSIAYSANLSDHPVTETSIVEKIKTLAVQIMCQERQK